MATTANPDLPLTEQFLRYGRYVRNWSPRTVECYRQALRECPGTITKASLNATVVAMRERGLTPGGINLRARAINSYLTWLHEDGHVSERLKIRMLRNPPKPVQTLNGRDIHTLATFRPKGRIQTRTWMLAMVLLDCGLRLTEALTLERDNVDLDNLVLRVLGKGHKERLVVERCGSPQCPRQQLIALADLRDVIKQVIHCREGLGYLPPKDTAAGLTEFCIDAQLSLSVWIISPDLERCIVTSDKSGQFFQRSSVQRQIHFPKVRVDAVVFSCKRIIQFYFFFHLLILPRIATAITPPVYFLTPVVNLMTRNWRTLLPSV